MAITGRGVLDVEPNQFTSPVRQIRSLAAFVEPVRRPTIAATLVCAGLALCP